jgi:hypothetical protein
MAGGSRGRYFRAHDAAFQRDGRLPASKVNLELRSMKQAGPLAIRRRPFT